MALTNDEKQELAKRISRGVQVVCSSIAQLHLGSPDPNASEQDDETGLVRSLRDHGANNWKFTDIEGGLLLTRDRNGNCHFKIYDLNVYKLRFQYELYENLVYSQLSSQLHSFEMENCMCGFLFSDQRVANKFFQRVQANITYVDRPANFKPQIKNLDIQHRDSGSTKSDGTPTNQLLIDPDNVPGEWREILKGAGIRRKDLRNPKMQETIKQVLLKFGISLDDVAEEMDEQQLQTSGWTPEQVAEYEKYQRDLAEYEASMEKYRQELAQFEEEQRALEREKRLQEEMANIPPPPVSRRPDSGLPLPPPRRKKDQAPDPPARKPVASAVMPVTPALPPKRKDSQAEKMDKLAKIAKVVNPRASVMVLKVGFLNEMKDKGTKQLTHHSSRIKTNRMSTLPALNNVKKEDKQGILGALLKQMAAQREHIADDDSDSDSDNDDDWID